MRLLKGNLLSRSYFRNEAYLHSEIYTSSRQINIAHRHIVINVLVNF